MLVSAAAKWVRRSRRRVFDGLKKFVKSFDALHLKFGGFVRGTVLLILALCHVTGLVGFLGVGLFCLGWGWAISAAF
jgi:hypothetical protein